jgi:hypothetical protein
MFYSKYWVVAVCFACIAVGSLASAQSPTPAKRPGDKQVPTPAKRPETKPAQPEPVKEEQPAETEPVDTAAIESASTDTVPTDDETKAATVDSSAKPVSKSATTPANSTPAEPPVLRKVERKTMTETPSASGGEEYLLRYNLQPGMVISSEVTHLAKTDTKIDSTEQNSQSRTVSQKIWEVTKAVNGEMTFEYKILEIDMSQRIGNDNELRYSSKSGEEPLRQFKAAAASVGKVISTVTIDEQGMIIARSDKSNPPNLGMGDITLPVPKKPIAIGATWEVPREMRIMREDGSIKTVRFRELFRFDKVSAGVATIAVRSEMLTPISEPKEEAQVLQQLSNGTIKFDIDAGRMISKELGWDKVVVAFSGAGSVMDYSARLEEQVVKAEQKFGANKSANKAKPATSR